MRLPIFLALLFFNYIYSLYQMPPPIFPALSHYTLTHNSSTPSETSRSLSPLHCSLFCLIFSSFYFPSLYSMLHHYNYLLHTLSNPSLYCTLCPNSSPSLKPPLFLCHIQQSNVTGEKQQKLLTANSWLHPQTRPLIKSQYIP